MGVINNEIEIKRHSKRFDKIIKTLEDAAEQIQELSDDVEEVKDDIEQVKDDIEQVTIAVNQVTESVNTLTESVNNISNQIGDTDISEIGDTITSAISTLNSNLTKYDSYIHTGAYGEKIEFRKYTNGMIGIMINSNAIPKTLSETTGLPGWLTPVDARYIPGQDYDGRFRGVAIASGGRLVYYPSNNTGIYINAFYFL